jgi:4-diphosphocytidyl-2-C-methyl-D-erythritol kinase
MKALYDLPAPAKLNLFLHVVGKRDDGYHLLQSMFVPIDWMDTLHLESRPDGALQRHDIGTPLPAHDLCLRAAQLLQRTSGTGLGADIHIEKRIPSGAGMGGGSSDAATVLIGLNRLWNLHMTRQQLMPLALQLGADVPFFLGTGSAWIEGIGELITPIHLDPEKLGLLAVVKPSDSLPTQAIFASRFLQRSETVAIVAGSFEDTWKAFRNDLQAAAASQSSQIDQALVQLEKVFGNSRMTGSGSAVFSTVGNQSIPAATDLAQFLKLPGSWEGRFCRSLASMPLAGWLTS